MIVSPSARRQGFEFQMAEIGKNIIAVDGNMPGVMENRHVGIPELRGFGRSAVIVHEHDLRIRLAIRFQPRIQSVFLHSRHTVTAAASALMNDVGENPVRFGKQSDDFPDLFTQKVQIRRIETHLMKMRIKRIINFPGIFHLAPFRMFFGSIAVDPGGQINRRCDSDFATGLHLRPQQIKIQMRMPFPDLGIVIRIPVMTGCKQRNGIDRRF